MTRARLTIKLDAGVGVDLLFTPHLYAYKGRGGATLDLPDEGLDKAAALRQTLSLYADIYYLAAVNAWELDEHEGDFPYKRGDFHEWAAAHPKDNARAMVQAVEALTGKPLKAATEGENGEGGEIPHPDAINPSSGSESSKKKASAKNGRRWKPFSSGR